MLKRLQSLLSGYASTGSEALVQKQHDMLVVRCSIVHLLELCQTMHQHDDLQMNQLLDLCVVDHLHYGRDEWVGAHATAQGFDRARTPLDQQNFSSTAGRFEMVYHLLSTVHNQRIRLKVCLDAPTVLVPSVTDIWANANWYEREAFDLFGIRFSGHPDLRRILTDYGFVGYPMRKDFPLQGRVELRYDAALERCLYEPVTIDNRVSVPKVIRRDDDRMEIRN